MANSVCEVLLTEAPLKALNRDVDGEAGAVVDFWGVVRELENGSVIEGIDYECHVMMARHQLRVLAEAAVGEFHLNKVIVHHRIGFVPMGHASLLVQVQAKHRDAAFEASKWIVAELKKKVPIWKKPRFKVDSPAPKLRNQPRSMASISSRK
jgi:molybdopterin synthase catalytic subunit